MDEDNHRRNEAASRDGDHQCRGSMGRSPHEENPSTGSQDGNGYISQASSTDARSSEIEHSESLRRAASIFDRNRFDRGTAGPTSANGSGAANRTNPTGEGIEICVIDPVLFEEVMAACNAITSTSAVTPASSDELRPVDYQNGLVNGAASTQTRGSAPTTQSPMIQRAINRRISLRRERRSREPVDGYSTNDNSENTSTTGSHDAGEQGGRDPENGN